LHTGQDSYAFTEYTSQLVKDVRRSIDYLESRDDIEPGVAFYGMSWGGMIGTIVPAVEDRIRTVILMPTLLLGRGRPEVSQINYIPRITVPTLILGGEYDTISPVERSIRPVYEMLGTPEEHKALKLFPTDHIPPKNDFIRETLDWLDRYLGPVQ
jgi:pimeloyl-ACP methyl ester carboxylesterase